jgi:cytochrome P450
LGLLDAANRNVSRWENPERFAIGRKARGHVAFGARILMCVGQRLARIEIAGEAMRRLNNGLRQSGALPIELTPA